MVRTCLKCEHLNPAAPGDDLDACPNCGAIYSRVEAAVARQRASDLRASFDPKRLGSFFGVTTQWSRLKQLGFLLLGICLLVAIGMALFAQNADPVEYDSPPATGEARRARVVESPSQAVEVPPNPAACDTDDAICIGKRDLYQASGPCSRAVEMQLTYRHEWQDTWYEEKFDQVMWYEPTRTILFHGNRLQAQNGFGAWKKLSYSCIWDVANKQVVRALVNE